jgi:hypothetical protein
MSDQLTMPAYYVVIVREITENGEKKMKAYYESGPYHSLAKAIEAKPNYTERAAIAQVDMPLTLLF